MDRRKRSRSRSRVWWSIKVLITAAFLIALALAPGRGVQAQAGGQPAQASRSADLPNWRFVDWRFSGASDGSRGAPYKTFVDGAAGTPAGGVLWMQPGNYTAGGVYNSPVTWNAPVGGVVLEARGSKPWLALLCKFSDQNQEPQNVAYFGGYMTLAGAGTGGMYDYFRAISLGAVNLSGSDVAGWYTVDFTEAAAAGMSRAQKIDACASKAANDVHFPDYYGIVAMFNAQTDSGSAGVVTRSFDGVTKDYGYLVIGFDAWNVTFAGHEMLHGLGLDHSFDDSGQICSAGAQPGEYCDPWDIMSAMVAYAFPGKYGSSADWQIPFGAGPGLNAAYIDKMGWMPQQRIATGTGTVVLAALSHPEAAGSLMAKIPLGANDYYTVEFRRKDGWDAGIPQNTVLIHEMKSDGHSYLIRANGGPERLAGSTFLDAARNVSVNVQSIDPSTNRATVVIGPAH